MDLRTNYLGLKLKNPLVPSASPLTRSVDTARRLEDAGAGAVVMYSLFEEELIQEESVLKGFLAEQAIGHAEAQDFLPLYGDAAAGLERYLEQLRRLKDALDIPVIASLNGFHLATWLDQSRAFQEAGADALELNVYYIAADADQPGEEVEQRYIDLLTHLRTDVTLPIVVKLSPQFSSVANMVKRLELAGADGVALFNRFYQPDVDLDTLRIAPTLHLSNSTDALLPMRWIGMLRGQVDFTLAATSGIHTAEDALKMVAVGADVTHLCSTLLANGPGQLATILRGMEQWLEESDFETLEQLKGVASEAHVSDAGAYARANYINMLDNYTLGEAWPR